jgi:protein phosphatase
VKIIGRTHPGQVRPTNEDAFDFDSDLGVAVLADGMGGLNAGEVASATAVAAVLGELAAAPEVTPAAVASAIEIANQHVYELSQRNRELRDMGTTLVVWAALGAGRFAVGHVGDSRAYRLNGDGVQPLTRDHSVVQAMVDQGLMTADEARVATNRNVITRAVGLQADVHVDVEEISQQPGDCYLLCSDGLTDMLDDAQLQSYWQEHRHGPREVLAEHLVDAALIAGGYDNISVVVVG